MRETSMKLGVAPFAEGSCLINFGRTQVLCTASVEDSVPRWMKGSGKGWITAEYSMLPRSTTERSQREVSRGRPGGRTMEIQRLIGRSLRSVVSMQEMGERSLTIDCDCLVADGGTRTASITGGFVAMYEAFRWMQNEMMIPSIPIDEYVAAVSTGVVNDKIWLDLDYELDVKAQVDMNVVMTSSGNLIEVQGTAEGKPFPRSTLDQMLDLAGAGIKELIEAQHACLDA